MSTVCAPPMSITIGAEMFLLVKTTHLITLNVYLISLGSGDIQGWEMYEQMLGWYSMFGWGVNNNLLMLKKSYISKDIQNPDYINILVFRCFRTFDFLKIFFNSNYNLFSDLFHLSPPYMIF